MALHLIWRFYCEEDEIVGCIWDFYNIVGCDLHCERGRLSVFVW